MSLALSEFLDWRKHGYADTRALGECLQALVDEGLDQLPMPASGQTLDRWRSLACVAGHDLGLCKLYEGHTDALAIMQELGFQGFSSVPAEPGSTWGVWAAEPPQARVRVSGSGSSVQLDGRKAWCSGAAVLSHSLVTAWNDDGQQQLVAVDLRQAGVTVTQDGWRAVGMGATGSFEVQFKAARGVAVGPPGAYIERAGFWQGGIGIAACWYGAARAIASRLLQHVIKQDEPHAQAHLGAVDTALHSALSVLHHAASCIDNAPEDNAEHTTEHSNITEQSNIELLARRSRAAIEFSAEQIITHVGHALGAGPYCKDAHFARLVADLPVFLRQSHAERDLAALGRLTAAQPITPSSRTWML
ncbi:acyl-CoA dehydrogenase family protein [Pseudomonas syringae]|uniref:Acyl-CoA dehydrogenase n=1 Tax=Pseudomonas syringae TaxID=317 RepID=A0A085VNE2_PSESX|nr:acyl-CoA dehydrogenase family protein [Pseudomonas syringae]KFE56955.1 acyl-CoA dehydrogenase [Pseudomonas syringae]